VFVFVSCRQALLTTVCVIITCLSLVPDIIGVEHIKGTPVDRRLPPVERTAEIARPSGKQTFKVSNTFILQRSYKQIKVIRGLHCSLFFQMNLSMKFKMTSSCQPSKITSLKMNTPYPIERADKLQTKFGWAILLTLPESPQTFVTVFLPKRYSAHFTESDIRSINEKFVSLALKYLGNSPQSNSFILEIE
jgi:hypothetical protein